MTKKNEITACTKSRAQIATEYNVDYKTLMRRLKNMDITLPSGAIFKADQKRIYEALGYPNNTIRKQFDNT